MRLALRWWLFRLSFYMLLLSTRFILFCLYFIFCQLLVNAWNCLVSSVTLSADGSHFCHITPWFLFNFQFVLIYLSVVFFIYSCFVNILQFSSVNCIQLCVTTRKSFVDVIRCDEWRHLDNPVLLPFSHFSASLHCHLVTIPVRVAF